MNREGDIDRLAVPFESALLEDIVFTRAAEKISKEVLQTLIGDYTLEGTVVNVSLAGGTLRIETPSRAALIMRQGGGKRVHLPGSYHIF